MVLTISRSTANTRRKHAADAELIDWQIKVYIPLDTKANNIRTK